MKKIYLGKESTYNDREVPERIFLELEEEDIIEKLSLEGLVYVEKEYVGDISQYHIFNDGDMSKEEAENYFFVEEDTFNEVEKVIISEGIDSLCSERIESLVSFEEGEEEISLSEIVKSIEDKMKQRAVSGDEMNFFLSYSYWDGSNLRQIILEDSFYDTEYEDYTEEFQDKEEIDRERYNTYLEVLYELQDGRKALLTISFYQGSLPSIKWVDSHIETIEELHKENPPF